MTTSISRGANVRRTVDSARGSGRRGARGKWGGRCLAGAAVGLLVGSASAELPLVGEYTLTSSATPIVGGYRFDFQVKNENQGFRAKEGLDGFYVSIPQGATIWDMVMPPAFYGVPGYWSTSLPPMMGPKGVTEEWLQFWGNNPESVYPMGATADFSFKTDTVTSPTIDLLLVTYWDLSEPAVEHVTTSIGMSYTVYATSIGSPGLPPLGGVNSPIDSPIDSPVNPPIDPPVNPPVDSPIDPPAAPEPTALAFLVVGGSGLLLRRRR